MALLSTKFPSRKTVARMSRSEVEERVAKMAIELPPLSTKHPAWWSDAYDHFLALAGITETEFVASQTERRADWTRHQAQDVEHPQAREKLFLECLRQAVERAGLRELNSIIEHNLRDEVHVPVGCTAWTHWMQRRATRLERETAVMGVLSAKDKET